MTSALDLLRTTSVCMQVWKHVSLGQMRLVVLARSDMHMLLGNAAAATVATGVAGVGSNKGAVAISCQVWGNELCFVNAHLAAHQSKVKERNKMYRVRFTSHSFKRNVQGSARACPGSSPPVCSLFSGAGTLIAPSPWRLFVRLRSFSHPIEPCWRCHRRTAPCVLHACVPSLVATYLCHSDGHEVLPPKRCCLWCSCQPQVQLSAPGAPRHDHISSLSAHPCQHRCKGKVILAVHAHDS